MFHRDAGDSKRCSTERAMRANSTVVSGAINADVFAHGPNGAETFKRKGLFAHDPVRNFVTHSFCTPRHNE